MIVKKLNDVSGGGFPGARYNEKKIADGVATLMAMENVSEALRHNVETLHRFGLDASAEVERYLKTLRLMAIQRRHVFSSMCRPL